MKTKEVKRRYDGLLLIDKPAGMTSAAVVGKLKRRFGIDKIGHTGTLDPMATGLLVVVCGVATRLQNFIKDDRKTYEGLIRFGIATDTDDITGNIIEQGSTANYLIPDASSRIELLAKNFLGNIEQVPPRVSAVKLDGKRSYERARAGEAFELSSRPATIYELELNFLSEELLSYRVQCSRGTYVRSLARDFGRVLGVPATLESIRRITSGPFHISQATSLDELIDPTLCDEIALLPVELLLSDLPRVTVPTEVLFRLSQGNQADLRSSQELGLPSEGNVVLMVTSDGRPSGILERSIQGDGNSAWGVKFMLAAALE